MKKVLLIAFVAFQLYSGTKAKPCKKGKCQKKVIACPVFTEEKQCKEKNKIIKQKMFHICYNQNKKGKVMSYD
jgi:hypothetical protein